MGRTTVLITLHGSKHPVLGASARRPILVYQAATSEEELLRIHLPGTSVNKGLSPSGSIGYVQGQRQGRKSMSEQYSLAKILELIS